MYWKQNLKVWTVMVGWTVCVLPCTQAQNLPSASPSAQQSSRPTRSAVMDMRVPTRLSTPQASLDNNLLITGNVGGAKHFRASVPYRDTRALQTTVPSDSLMDFFRISQTQDFRASSPQAFTPYYSPSTTVAHTAAGHPGIISPRTSLPTFTADGFGRRPTQPAMELTSRETTVSQEDLSDPQKKITPEDRLDSLAERSLFTPSPWQPDGLWQIPDNALQIDARSIEDVNRPSIPSTAADLPIQPQDPNGLDSIVSMRSGQGGQDPNTADTLAGSAYAMTSQMAMHAYAQTKCNHFMHAGETYLKQGRYDKAVDAYSLASVYQSGHILAVAGKSHALLGKRAYSSSALHLIRVLNKLPDYAKTDMGLSDLLGGFELLKDHISRLETYTEGPHVPDLKLLLAFLYVQAGDLGMAQKTMEYVPPDFSYETARLALLEASGRAEG